MPAKFEIVPPETVMSANAKSVTDSLIVNVRPAVSPALTLVLSTPNAIVGRTVLTVIVWVLSASAPSTFKLPAASENLLLATLTTPLVVLSAVGVKTTE